MKYNKCKIISEICCNHAGKISTAKEMIRMSKICGADYAKFQKRNPIKAVPQALHSQPHPCPMHSCGQTYLQHRQALEFSLDQHRELQKHCQKVGIGYACSVWDIDSAKDVISLSPDFIKVPSAMNENYELLDYLFSNYTSDIHISLGMISEKNKNILIDYLTDNKKREDRTVVYHTTSDYPVKFEELFLFEIEKLGIIFNRVGYSGHHLGIAADMCAYTLGAEWVERHFTLDRTAKGTDSSASLEPSGLQKLCRDLKACHKALTYKDVDMTENEQENSKKLKVKTTS